MIWCCSDKWKKCGKVYNTCLSWKWDCTFLLALFELIVLHWHRNYFIIHILKMVSNVVSRVLKAGCQCGFVLWNWNSKPANSDRLPFPTIEYCLHPLDYPFQQWSIVYIPWITLSNSGVLFKPPGLPFPTVEYCLHPLDYPSQQWSIVYTPWELSGRQEPAF